MGIPGGWTVPPDKLKLPAALGAAMAANSGNGDGKKCGAAFAAGDDAMSGKRFVMILLMLMALFMGAAILFNFYPPAANSPWTLVGLVVALALAALVVRRVR